MCDTVIKKNLGVSSTKCGNRPCEWYTCIPYLIEEKWPHFRYFFIPDGMTFYHGGGISKYNVPYPGKRDFYDPKIINDEQRNKLKNTKNNRDFLNVLKKSQEEGFYDSYEVALTYSQQSGCGDSCISTYVTNAKEKFRFQHTSGMYGFKLFDLFDPWNFIIMIGYNPSTQKELEGPGFGLDEKSKIFLRKVYGMPKTGYVDLSQYIYLNENNIYVWRNQKRKSFRNANNPGQPYESSEPEYFVLKKIGKILNEKFNYAGLANPRTTDGRFPEMILYDSAYYVLERNYSNDLDWQYQYKNINPADIKKLQLSEIGKLIDYMKKNYTTNVAFHAGNLYAHSVWTALYVQEMLEYKEKLYQKNPQVRNLRIEYKNLIENKYLSVLNSGKYNSKIDEKLILISKEIVKKSDKKLYKMSKWLMGQCIYDDRLILIAAFLHDIGKIYGDEIYYDKPDHPTEGEKLLKGELKYKNFNAEKFFADIGVTTITDKAFIAGIVKYHWDFGDGLRRYKLAKSVEKGNAIIVKYISQFMTYIFSITGKPVITVENIYLMRCMLIVLIAVSAADIMATQPYINRQIIDNLTAYLIENGCIDSQGKLLQAKKCNINSYVHVLPYLTNVSRDYMGGKKYEDFKIDTEGYDFRNKIIDVYDNNLKYFYSR